MISALKIQVLEWKHLVPISVGSGRDLVLESLLPMLFSSEELFWKKFSLRNRAFQSTGHEPGAVGRSAPSVVTWQNPVSASSTEIEMWPMRRSAVTSDGRVFDACCLGRS